MENKKMTIAIIILIILIIAIVGFNFAFSEFNNKQTNILTEETNKILQSDITKENIDFNIKTERNYAVVEKAIKEYISELKNIYKELKDDLNIPISDKGDLTCWAKEGVLLITMTRFKKLQMS